MINKKPSVEGWGICLVRSYTQCVHPEQFLLDENHEPTVVAGCPPDAFSDEGQKWGNPIYDWERMERRQQRKQDHRQQ